MHYNNYSHKIQMEIITFYGITHNRRITHCISFVSVCQSEIWARFTLYLDFSPLDHFIIVTYSQNNRDVFRNHFSSISVLWIQNIHHLGAVWQSRLDCRCELTTWGYRVYLTSVHYIYLFIMSPVYVICVHCLCRYLISCAWSSGESTAHCS